jgi:imidazolonepropionase-like amidohydrolase
MQKLLLLTITASAVAAAQPSNVTQSGTAVAFANVGVLPMDRDTLLRDQTVVVRDGNIVEVGPASTVRVPQDAARVEGRGKFLMPAVAEMHAHIPGAQAPDALVERTLFLYAANGIGTIRGMQGHPRHLQYRERVAKGELFSPRIYAAGPGLNAKTAATPVTAAQAVVEQKAAGYNLLKILPGIPRVAFDALAAKANETGIRFAGHVPADVGLQRALEAKYHSIDHLDGYVEALAKTPGSSAFFGLNLINQLDESRLPALVAATRAAGTWMVPTQVLFDSMLSDESPETMAQWAEMKYMPAETVKRWVGQKTKNTASYSRVDRQKFIGLRRKILKALLDGGVPFALGSDAPQWWNVPGFSVHRELKSMVAAGFTPFQALQSGTVNPARYFGTSSATGTVASGMRADLLLLDANPLVDIGNSGRIAGVMLNGRWMSRADIDKRLAALAVATQ